MSETEAAPPPELTIEFPEITHNGGKYSSMTLCEPTMEQVLSSDAVKGAQGSVLLISVVSGMPRDVIGKLPISKVRQAMEYLGYFTQRPIDWTGA